MVQMVVVLAGRLVVANVGRGELAGWEHRRRFRRRETLGREGETARLVNPQGRGWLSEARWRFLSIRGNCPRENETPPLALTRARVFPKVSKLGYGRLVSGGRP